MTAVHEPVARGREAAPVPAAGSGLLVQRSCACASPSAGGCSCAEPEGLTVQRLAAPGASADGGLDDAPVAGSRPAGRGALLVDDDATPGAGQMRKSDFLAALRPRVCAVADAELARAGRNTEGCPYLDRWFSYYARTDAGHAEAALLRFAPQAAAARSASDYLPAVAERVRRAVARWADTGEVPAAIAEGMGGAGGGVLGALAGSGGVVGAVAGLATSVASLFTKGPDRQPPPSAARAVQSRLGGGQPLPSGVRTGMERALGHDFSRVRIHTDSTAAALSSRLDARAFTVGADVAFAAGQWQPGTPVGDAVLAHELAHVVQQAHPTYDTSAGPAFAQRQGLEDDADHAAAGAVARLWEHDADKPSIAARLQELKANAVPRLRSGLRLQRCAGAQQAGPQPSAPYGPLVPLPPNAGSMSDRARQIVATAQQTTDVGARVEGFVNAIIQEYFSADAGLVSAVEYTPSLSRGLQTTRTGEAPTYTGKISVSAEFATPDGSTGAWFARRVNQVDHELEHVRQYRRGLVGENRSTLREFLAFSRAALQTEIPGTGRIGPSTRINLIHAAIGEYYCLSADEQRQYAPQLRVLQQERARQIQRRANFQQHSSDVAPEPTSCVESSNE